MRSWCFDSQESGGVYDREYGSADIREVVYKIVGNGLFMDTDTSLQVVADSGLTVKVQPGNCFINGAFGAVDTAESLTFDASASGRYDIVVARFDLSLSYRSIRLAVIKGTEGSSAAATPTKTASVYDLQLAKVNIRSGATSILQTDITDTRTDPTVCGVVNGVSSQAAALQSQINDMGSAKQDKTNSLATEAALDDADSLPFYDASASAHRKTLWSNIKAKLKAYLDTFYLLNNLPDGGTIGTSDYLMAYRVSAARSEKVSWGLIMNSLHDVYYAGSMTYSSTYCDSVTGIAYKVKNQSVRYVSLCFHTKTSIPANTNVVLGDMNTGVLYPNYRAQLANNVNANTFIEAGYGTITINSPTVIASGTYIYVTGILVG